MTSRTAATKTPTVGSAVAIGVALFLVAAASLPAEADTVRVVTSGDVGQGWRFLDNDGKCKVVTAAHVVKTMAGKVLKADIVDISGVSSPTGEPVLLSPEDDVDIAVLSVPSQNAPSLCGDGRLSPIAVERRARALSGLFMETAARDTKEVGRLPVQRSAGRMDAGRGEIFAVRSAVPGTQIVAGFSGSPVIDSEGPVGIVTNVLLEKDGVIDEVEVVRIDAVRRVMAAAQKRAPAARPVAGGAPTRTILVLAGNTPDPGFGANQMILTARSEWRVAPAAKVIAFVVGYERPIQVRRVHLAFRSEPADAIVGMEVSTSTSGSADDWVSVNYCRAAGGGVVACGFIPSTVRRLRIRLTTMGEGLVGLSGWTAE